MSPTVFRYNGYRFFFFSREEERMHVHVIHADGEAKVWLEPEIELQSFVGLRSRQVKEIMEKVTEHRNEIKENWNRHFGQ
ncbi:MAG: DUF4160 domain-containing protein [Balneolales bacterium]